MKRKNVILTLLVTVLMLYVTVFSVSFIGKVAGETYDPVANEWTLNDLNGGMSVTVDKYVPEDGIAGTSEALGTLPADKNNFSMTYKLRMDLQSTTWVSLRYAGMSTGNVACEGGYRLNIQPTGMVLKLSNSNADTVDTRPGKTTPGVVNRPEFPYGEEKVIRFEVTKAYTDGEYTGNRVRVWLDEVEAIDYLDTSKTELGVHFSGPYFESAEGTVTLSGAENIVYEEVRTERDLRDLTGFGKDVTRNSGVTSRVLGTIAEGPENNVAVRFGFQKDLDSNDWVNIGLLRIGADTNGIGGYRLNINNDGMVLKLSNSQTDTVDTREGKQTPGVLSHPKFENGKEYEIEFSVVRATVNGEYIGNRVCVWVDGEGVIDYLDTSKTELGTFMIAPFFNASGTVTLTSLDGGDKNENPDRFETSSVQTIEYNAVNIEDFMETAKGYSLPVPGAVRTEEDNIYLPSYDCNAQSGVRRMEIKGDYSDFAIRYRVQYRADADLWLVHELRGVSRNGMHWADTGNAMIHMRYWGNNNSGDNAARAGTGEFRFYPSGVSSSYATVKFDKNLALKDGVYYTVEFGCQTIDESDMMLFIKVSNGDDSNPKTVYAQAYMTGTMVANQTGFIVIENAPYNSLADEFAEVNQMQDITVCGMESGVLSKYVPKTVLDTEVENYDIADLVPITSAGALYTRTSLEENVPGQSILNAENVRGSYTLTMKLTFAAGNGEGDHPFDVTVALRSADAWASSGYMIKIRHDALFIQTAGPDGTRNTLVKTERTIAPGTYEVEIGCIDYYDDAESYIPSGVYVYLRFAGEDTNAIEAYVEKISDSGYNISGQIEGKIGSTLKVESAGSSFAAPPVALSARNDKVAVGKSTRLSVENPFATLNDVVTYEVVSGNASVDGEVLTVHADGIVRVRAKIVNEYGTFYSGEIEITAGTGKAETGCGSAIGGTAVYGILPIILAVGILSGRRKISGKRR